MWSYAGRFYQCGPWYCLPLQAAYAVELVQGLLTDAQQWNGSQQEQTVQAAQELLHKFRQHKVDTAAYQPLANSAIKLARLCNTEDTAQRIPSLRSETGAYVFECRGLEGFDTACSYLAGGDVDRFEVVVLKASSVSTLFFCHQWRKHMQLILLGHSNSANLPGSRAC